MKTWQERFWECVGTRGSDECWLWMGSVDGSGYGQFSLHGRNVSAHRAAALIAFGEIDPGAWVLHHCDVPRCVNPGHLYLGSPSDNMRDCLERGRHGQVRKTHCPQGHAYDDENTYRSAGRRWCRACGRAKAARYKERRKAASLW